MCESAFGAELAVTLKARRQGKRRPSVSSRIEWGCIRKRTGAARVNSYLGEVFAGRIVDCGIGRVQERTSGAGLASALTEEFAGNMFSVCGVIADR